MFKKEYEERLGGNRRAKANEAAIRRSTMERDFRCFVRGRSSSSFWELSLVRQMIPIKPKQIARHDKVRRLSAMPGQSAERHAGWDAFRPPKSAVTGRVKE